MCNLLTPLPSVKKKDGGKTNCWEGHNGAQHGCIKTPVGKATGGKGECVHIGKLLLPGCVIDTRVC